MARLIETEAEKTSSPIDKLESLMSYQKSKLNSMTNNSTAPGPRKFSFKTKQHSFNNNFQSKYVATKLKVNKNSTVAELASKFNTIVVNDDDEKNSRHHLKVKKQHNIDIPRSVKDLSSKVKEAIQIFEQSVKNDINRETNANIKKSTEIILIRQNSSQIESTKISETDTEEVDICLNCDVPTNPVTLNKKLESTDLKFKEKSGKTCYIETKQRPLSILADLSHKNCNINTRTECEQFLTNMRNNLRHTSSLMDLNISSQRDRSLDSIYDQYEKNTNTKNKIEYTSLNLPHNSNTHSTPAELNTLYLWRSIGNKFIEKDLEQKSEGNDNTCDTTEQDAYDAYSYIEMNVDEISVDNDSEKQHVTQLSAVTYMSLPNLNTSYPDDTYEELNYYSGQFVPKLPEKKSIIIAENIYESAPTLPEKKIVQPITDSRPDVSRYVHPSSRLYQNKNLPDLVRQSNTENHYYEPKLITDKSQFPNENNRSNEGRKQRETILDGKYAIIIKPNKRNQDQNYNYESIASVKEDSDSTHYNSILDDTYDDVLNVMPMDNCYESIKASSPDLEYGSFWEKDNSIYGIKAPSVLSNHSTSTTLSSASGFNDSDEWVDVDPSDQEDQIVVYLPKKVSRSSTKRKGWIQKVRRQRSKLSGVRHILIKRELPPSPAKPAEVPTSRSPIPYTEHDTSSDSFDSDSDALSDELESRGTIHERDLPPPPSSSSPASSAQLNQNIYGFVKEAGRQMKKHWTLRGLGLNKIRKMSVGAISHLPGQILPKSSDSDAAKQPDSALSTTLPLPSPARRWSSFKTRFRPHTTSTFYVDGVENTPPSPSHKTDSTPSPPALPEKDFRRKSIALGTFSSNERDLRRASLALRPSSPPPPPPVPSPAITLLSTEESLNISDKSEKTLAANSWYAESGLFDPTADIPSYLDKDQIKHLPPQANAFWDNLWDSGNSSTPGGTSNSDTISDPGSDLHLRFIDEPLYQFYNASISELQLDSLEENGYEEIGSSQHRTSMVEIVTPSHVNRSLWCQLPEVIESGVLDTLDAGQRKLQEAKFELITSEASYVKSLSILEKHFIANPLLADSNILGKSDRKHLFGNVSAVRKCSERLLTALEQCWQDSLLLTNICEVVYKHITNKSFNIYIQYCSHQFYIDRTLKSLREKNPKFVEVLAELESNPVCQSLSLHSFLMLPMQRVTRLPLLFDAILTRLRPTHSEYETCHTALATLNKIVHECNEEARKMERYYEMLMLSRLIKFSAKEVKCLPVISSSRWLVRSGSLNFVNVDAKLTFGRKLSKMHYTKLYLFLFTDLLVITKKKSNGCFSVIDYCSRAMMQMTALEDTMPPTNKYLILLTILENHEHKTVEIVFCCDTESGRQRWLEATAPTSSINPEETLYEQWDCPQVTGNHTYTAQQPDELNLQPGDVINVLRKMSDGWYHGERIRDGQKGWFPGNYTSEIASSHARAKNLKQRYRLLALSGRYLQSQEMMKKRPN